MSFITILFFSMLCGKISQHKPFFFSQQRQHLVRYSWREEHSQQKPDSFPLYISKHQTDDIENTLSIIPSLILIDEILLNENKEVILFSAAFIHITFK